MWIEAVNLLLFVVVFALCFFILFKLRAIQSNVNELNDYVFHPKPSVTVESEVNLLYKRLATDQERNLPMFAK